MNKMPTFAVLLAAAAFVAALRTGAAGEDAPPAATGPKAVELRLAERKLWSDHVIWTRQYVVAAVAGSPDADAASNRLMRNQEDLGNAIVPYYGADAGTKLTALLKDHIKIAVDVVAAAKAADDPKLQVANARWHANADEIATFLSGANPNWKKEMLLAMLNDHLKLTTDEATARLRKDWDGDVATFDRIFDQALGMGDHFAEGIVKQFPARFPAATDDVPQPR